MYYLTRLTLAELMAERRACEQYAKSAQNQERFPQRVVTARNRVKCIKSEILDRK